jgi:transposase
MLRDLLHHKKKKLRPTLLRLVQVSHSYEFRSTQESCPYQQGAFARCRNYCSLDITSPVAEGINSKIMAIKRRVGGYRNRENFKTLTFFYCGKLTI